MTEKLKFHLLPTDKSNHLRATDTVFSNEVQKARHAKFIVGIFYFAVFTTSVQTFSYFYQFPSWSTLLASRQLFVPLWSSQWILWLDWEFAVRMILMVHFGGSLLAMIFWERWRWARIIAFISTFQYLSLISSFGKIDHYMHIMIVVEFMLIFLPQNKDKESSRQTLRIIFGIQSFILLTYFVSGAFKMLGIVIQSLAGQSSALSSAGFAQHVARSILEINRPTFFSSFILDHPSWLASAILVVGYLIEVCSVFIIWLPHRQRMWGFVLLIFHSTVLMTIGPDFTIQMLVVGIFLVFSPFSLKNVNSIGKVDVPIMK
jgi:hypothetical protein